MASVCSVNDVEEEEIEVSCSTKAPSTLEGREGVGLQQTEASARGQKHTLVMQFPGKVKCT